MEKLFNCGSLTDGRFCIVWATDPHKTEGNFVGNFGDVQRKMWELSDKGYRQHGRKLGDCALSV